MRKITVTEENFNKVLKRLQNICNKYKMFEFYRVFTENMEEKKQYRSNSIGFRDSAKRHMDENGNLTYKKVKEFFSYNKYVRVTKHHFREEFEQGKDTYEAKYAYPKMKSLIHMDLSGGSALVISEGDRVQFLPFGGFVVWTDNDFTRFVVGCVKLGCQAHFEKFLYGKPNSFIESTAEDLVKKWNTRI